MRGCLQSCLPGRAGPRIGIVLAHVLTRSAASSTNDLGACSIQSASNGQCQQTNEAVPPKGYNPYTLLNSTVVSPDSKLLRFALPPHLMTFGMPLPSCLKIKREFTYDGQAVTLDKSYSPVSFPDEQGSFELLVKGYPPHPGIGKDPGGLGAFLVGLLPGETADMKVKKPRLFHEAPYTVNRWKELGFVAGGTGLAPMVQMIRTILHDPMEETRLSLVFANRNQEDILMREELDTLAHKHSDRFRVHYVLSSPPSNWSGGRGWVGLQDVGTQYLPAPADGTMILVCGRDEFLETVSGQTARGPPAPGEKKGPKIQGELTGLLAAAGYEAKHVYKF